MGERTQRARPGASALSIAALATAALSGALAVAFATLLPQIAAGGAWTRAWEWIPSLGVSLAVRVDGLSLLFALLVTTTGAFVALYAGAYLADHPTRGRFFAFLALFELAMLGVVVADDLVTLFVFWELTTVTSFLLVGFEHENARARRNATQAALVTGAGGLALLAGVVLLEEITGSWRVSAVVAAGDAVREHALYGPVLVLVLLGAFTKSAQVPFHFWLPNAMAAPTPVSAYLHSATMVKAGIYLLARLHPALGGTPAWTWTLTIVGAVTAVWASVVALRQTDLKLALAYTTLMALGTLTMFLGAETPVALAAAMTFLLVHALYKCALFLVVGALDHEAGTREVDALRGLGRAMPRTAVAAGAAAFSMAGFPPFLGFIGKELKYEGALAVASEPALVATAAVLANALMVAVAGVLFLRPFFGAGPRAPRPPHDPPAAMWVGPLALGLAGLVFGLAPGIVGDALVQPAVAAVVGRGAARVDLALWHGVTVPLLLSLVTVGAGAAFYRWHRPLRRAIAAALARLPFTGDSAWDRGLAGTIAGAGRLTRAIQHGSLRGYLTVLFVTIGLGAGAALLLDGGLALPPAGAAPTAEDVGILGLLLAGIGLVLRARAPIAAVAGLGAVGTGVALVLLSVGAPDVALTQLVVEVLFVVILSLALPRIRSDAGPTAGVRTRLQNGAVALLVGGLVTALLLAVAATPPSTHVSDWYAAHSVPDAKGRNIVNVILVDFRAIDTLGEVVVVAAAALAGLALLRAARRRPTATGRPRREEVTS